MAEEEQPKSQRPDIGDGRVRRNDRIISKFRGRALSKSGQATFEKTNAKRRALVEKMKKEPKA